MFEAVVELHFRCTANCACYVHLSHVRFSGIELRCTLVACEASLQFPDTGQRRVASDQRRQPFASVGCVCPLRFIESPAMAFHRTQTHPQDTTTTSDWLKITRALDSGKLVVRHLGPTNESGPGISTVTDGRGTFGQQGRLVPQLQRSNFHRALLSYSTRCDQAQVYPASG
jgi:hypothetical protein